MSRTLREVSPATYARDNPEVSITDNLARRKVKFKKKQRV
jgi:hypothetical protein